MSDQLYKHLYTHFHTYTVMCLLYASDLRMYPLQVSAFMETMRLVAWCRFMQFSCMLIISTSIKTLGPGRGRACSCYRLCKPSPANSNVEITRFEKSKPMMASTMQTFAREQKGFASQNVASKGKNKAVPENRKSKLDQEKSSQS